MKYSIVIPVKNEEKCIITTIKEIQDELEKEEILYEIIVVNDASTDNTLEFLKNNFTKNTKIKIISRINSYGFGIAIQTGLQYTTGEYICIVMGDRSDDPKDIIKYYKTLLNGFDCVFGSRFMKESIVTSYPKIKLFVNRIANTIIRLMFGIHFNDYTNAFKAYKKEVINSIQPIISSNFNITIELPLKAILFNYNIKQVPINWYGRTSGVSKMSLLKMGKFYLSTLIYLISMKLISKDLISLKKKSLFEIYNNE